MWVFVVEHFELFESASDLVQTGEVTRSESLSLDYREVDFNLIQPTSMYWRMNKNRIGVFVTHAVDCCQTSMRRAVVHNPIHPPRIAVGFLLHHLIDQSRERHNSCLRFTTAKHNSTKYIPRRQVLQRTASFIFRFDSERLANFRWQTSVTSDACLDTGFLIAADYEIVVPQWVLFRW